MNNLYLTIFNKTYLVAAKALIRSFLRHNKNSTLVLVALDSSTATLLENETHPQIECVVASEVLDDTVFQLHASRGVGECCWGLKPEMLVWAIQTYPGFEWYTFLDTDMYFYGNPDTLLSTVQKQNVALTPHGYDRSDSKSMNFGFYCAQWVGFKNDTAAKAVLTKWQRACQDWCYGRIENGKYGDQKYLEQFAEWGGSIEELYRPGFILAPWNIADKSIVKRGENDIQILEQDQAGKLYCYHFHGLLQFSSRQFDLCQSYYPIDKAIEWIYYPYIVELKDICDTLSITPEFRKQEEHPLKIQKRKQLNRYYHYELDSSLNLQPCP